MTGGPTLTRPRGGDPESPVAPPRRRPTWPRWVPAFRLALRGARGNPGRSAVVVALVTLPVALVVGVTVVAASRAAAGPREDGPLETGIISDGIVLGVSIGLMQIVLLAGAAFAVSARRRQRELALMAAAGAEPGDLTRAVLAEAVLLGGTGAALGAVVPWVGLAAGRPVVQAATGWQLVALPPFPLALVLVPMLAVLACLAGAVPAARIAARVPVAQALRSVDGGSAPLSAEGRHGRRARVWSLLGAALIAAGVGAIARYVDLSAAALTEDGAGAPPALWLGLGLVLSQLGVVLLAPSLLGAVTRPRWLPLAARLAARDAARNGLRSAFAVAAVAAATGLAAAAAIWTGSVLAAATDSFVAPLPEGVAILGAADAPEMHPGGWVEQARWRTLTEADRRAVAQALPGADVALVAVAGLLDHGSPDGLALRSACDRLPAQGAPAALLWGDPVRSRSVAEQLPVDSGCLLPQVAGSFLSPSATAGLDVSLHPGVVVLEARDAHLMLGREDPAVTAALEEGMAVALTPRAVAGGVVRLRQVAAWLPEPRELPVADLPAVVIDDVPVRPAAVLVTPRALAGAGLAASPNALVVGGGEPAAAQLPAGLEVRGSVSRDVPVAQVAAAGLFVDLALPREPRDVVGVWGALLFALAATLLVTGLALSEARGDLAVMSAVGAAPQLRRRFAAWSAGVVALVGTALGALGGIMPAWAALSAVSLLSDPDRCLWMPSGAGPWDGINCSVPVAVPLVMPWAWLAALVVLVPVAAAVVQYLVTPARVALPRR